MFDVWNSKYENVCCVNIFEIMNETWYRPNAKEAKFSLITRVYTFLFGFHLNLDPKNDPQHE